MLPLFIITVSTKFKCLFMFSSFEVLDSSFLRHCRFISKKQIDYKLKSIQNTINLGGVCFQVLGLWGLSVLCFQDTLLAALLAIIVTVRICSRVGGLPFEKVGDARRKI